MKVTKLAAVTLTIVLGSGLLLLTAASCSCEQGCRSNVVVADGNSQQCAGRTIEACEALQNSEDDNKPSAVDSDQTAKPQEVLQDEDEEERFVANPFCQACHADFEDDELALNHMLMGVGCERCHGESERHRSDEDNITPPEIMYPRDKITPTCMMCHPRQDIDHVEDHDVILAGAETIFDEEPATPEEDKVCTDCHGQGHHLKVRTVRWNKATGEILK